MLAWHLGVRYLQRRRTAWLALAAITLTVAVPVLVLGVTQGFLDVTRRQARANESDLTVSAGWYGAGVPDSPALRSAISSHTNVAAVAPFVSFYALLTPRRGERAAGLPVLVDGVDWALDERLGRISPGLLHPPPVEDLSTPPIVPEHRGTGFLTPAWRAHLAFAGMEMMSGLGVAGALPPPPRLKPRPGIVTGRELLYGNGLNVGDVVELASSVGMKATAEISDTLGTGILEVDRFAAMAPLPLAQQLADFRASANETAQVGGYRVRTTSGRDLNATAASLSEAIGLRTETWLMRRGNLVKSLELQRNIMAIVMIAIQTITVFIVYAVFSTLVVEKRHDIGVLLGLGARRTQIAGAFLLAGFAACIGGGVLGWGLGWSALAALNPVGKWLGVPLFPQDVIYTPEAPTSFDPTIPLFFMGVMTLVGVIAVALPAWRASRIQPIDILREGG